MTISRNQLSLSTSQHKCYSYLHDFHVWNEQQTFLFDLFVLSIVQNKNKFPSPLFLILEESYIIRPMFLNQGSIL
jgi:hypothetical protein